MGNCLKANRIGVQEEIYGLSAEEEEIIRHAKFPTVPSKSSDTGRPIEGRKKKAVRFKVGDEAVSGRESDVVNEKGGGGVVRFRIVVTQQELNQILSCKKDSKYSSVEQLLNAMKVSSRRIMKVGSHGGDIGISGWRPALESIPEDQ